MKKIVCLLFVLVLVVFIACGNDDTTAPSSSSASSSGSVSSSSSSGGSSSSSSSSTSSSSSSSSGTSSSSSSSASIPNFLGPWVGSLNHIKDGNPLLSQQLLMAITNQDGTNFLGYSAILGDSTCDAVVGHYSVSSGTVTVIVSDTNDSGYGIATGVIAGFRIYGTVVQHNNRTNFSDTATFSLTNMIP